MMPSLAKLLLLPRHRNRNTSNPPLKWIFAEPECNFGVKTQLWVFLWRCHSQEPWCWLSPSLC